VKLTNGPTLRLPASRKPTTWLCRNLFCAPFRIAAVARAVIKMQWRGQVCSRQGCFCFDGARTMDYFHANENTCPGTRSINRLQLQNVYLTSHSATPPPTSN